MSEDVGRSVKHMWRKERRQKINYYAGEGECQDNIRVKKSEQRLILQGITNRAEMVRDRTIFSGVLCEPIG